MTTATSIDMAFAIDQTSPLSWENGYAERLIGSIRRECLDHVAVFSEHHLRHLLLSYMKYYNGVRMHPWRRMHRSRAPSIAPGTFFVAQSRAGRITNMPGFNLRRAQPFSFFDKKSCVSEYQS